MSGKKASSKNAVKHGLRMESFNPVITDVESPEAWKAHLNGMLESLQPEGYHEEEIAARIAEILWRLRRVAVFERDRIYASIIDIGEDAMLAAHILRQDISDMRKILPYEEFVQKIGTRILPDAVNKITRYEAHLHRLYIQTLHELEAIQARRRGEPIALARLDISVPPAG